MKLAEYCNTSPTYIGEIEVGKKFLSMDMIEKISTILRIKPYHFFINRTEQNVDANGETIYPKLPKSIQNEVRKELNLSINELIRETLEKY